MSSSAPQSHEAITQVLRWKGQKPLVGAGSDVQDGPRRVLCIDPCRHMDCEERQGNAMGGQLEAIADQVVLQGLCLQCSAGFTDW